MTTAQIDPFRLHTTRSAADILGLYWETLPAWREQGKGPKFVRIGRNGRNIRYREIDLIEWLTENTVDPAASKPGKSGSKPAPAAVQAGENRWAAPHLRGSRPQFTR